MVIEFNDMEVIDGLNKSSFSRMVGAQDSWEWVCERIGTGTLETMRKVEHQLEQGDGVKRWLLRWET